MVGETGLVEHAVLRPGEVSENSNILKNFSFKISQ